MSFKLHEYDEEIICDECGERAAVKVSGFEAQVLHNSDRVTIHGDPLEGARKVYVHVTDGGPE